MTPAAGDVVLLQDDHALALLSEGQGGGHPASARSDDNGIYDGVLGHEVSIGRQPTEL